MRCAQCTKRNSVAARKCRFCGEKLQRKPSSPFLKLFGLLLVLVIGAATIAPSLITSLMDPEEVLARVGRRVAAGPTSPGDASRIKDDFCKALNVCLTKIGNMRSCDLSARLKQLLPSTAFEIHVVDLPRNLKIIEIDTLLQASDFLVMVRSTGIKAFPLFGIEVFDDARIFKDPDGPMLVLIGHSGGQLPHSPQVKAYALLPDYVSDETDKLIPAVRGEGTAKFDKNGRDISLNLSLFSLAALQNIRFADIGVDDPVVHQHLVWKDAHYVPTWQYGSDSLSLLYQVACCMQRPELLKIYYPIFSASSANFIKSAFPGKSVASKDNDKVEIKKVASGNNRLTYIVEQASRLYQIKLAKKGGVWTVNDITTRNAQNAVLASSPSTAKTGLAENVESLAAGSTVNTRATTDGDGQEVLATSVLRNDNIPNKIDISKKNNIQEKGNILNKDNIVDKDLKAASKLDKKAAVLTANSRKHLAQKAHPALPASSEFKSSHLLDSSLEHSSGHSVNHAAERAHISRYIAGATVRMRNGPSTESKAVNQIAKGTPVEIVSKHRGWYKIRFQGNEGFVYAGLVDFNKPHAYTTAVVTRKTRALLANARRQSLYVPQVGERVVVLSGIQNNKYKVQLANGQTGYVDKDAVDIAVEMPPQVP